MKQSLVGLFALCCAPAVIAQQGPLFQLLTSYDPLAVSNQPSTASFLWRDAATSDGRYLVFSTRAANHGLSISNTRPNYFRRDLQTGEVMHIDSAARHPITPGARLVDWENISIAADAPNMVVYVSEFPGSANPQIIAKNLTTGVTSLVSSTSEGIPGDGVSYDLSISSSGRYVAFSSNSTNLSQSSGVYRVYVKDMQTGALTLASKTLSGSPLNGDSRFPIISADGSALGFNNSESGAWLYRQSSNGSRNLCVNSTGEPLDAACAISELTSSGAYAFLDTTASNLTPPDQRARVYRVNLTSGAVLPVAWLNPNLSGAVRAVSSSDDGARVLVCGTKPVASGTPQPPNAYLWTEMSPQNSFVSLTQEGSSSVLGTEACGMSGNGEYAFYSSQSPDFLPSIRSGGLTIYRRSLTASTTVMASAFNSNELVLGAAAGISYMRRDSTGRFVNFGASSGNLVPAYIGGSAASYRLDVETLNIQLISVPSSGSFLTSGATFGATSSSGMTSIFQSAAANLPSAPGAWPNRIFLKQGNGSVAVINLDANGSIVTGSSNPSLSSDGSSVFYHANSNAFLYKTSDQSTIPLPRTGDGISVAYRSNNGRNVVSDDGSTAVVVATINSGVRFARLNLVEPVTVTVLEPTVDVVRDRTRAASSWLSATGQFVLLCYYTNSDLTSQAMYLVNVNRNTGRLIAEVSGQSEPQLCTAPRLDTSGRYATYTNLVSSGGGAILGAFRYDAITRETARVDVDATGSFGLRDVSSAQSNSDGSDVLFLSEATNFVLSGGPSASESGIYRKMGPFGDRIFGDGYQEVW